MLKFTKHQRKLLSHLAKNNKRSHNTNKAVEESVEFMEAIIKLRTKNKEHAPDPEEAIKEFGDVIFRGFVELMSIFPKHSIDEILVCVEERVEYKLGKLEQWKNEGKYKKGL